MKKEYFICDRRRRLNVDGNGVISIKENENCNLVGIISKLSFIKNDKFIFIQALLKPVMIKQIEFDHLNVKVHINNKYYNQVISHFNNNKEIDIKSAKINIYGDNKIKKFGVTEFK